MTRFFAKEYDVVVVGAGHAGCEAALCCARMGQRTLCLTMNPDSVGLMPCNPAIGGTSKGHLVRELDALGGEMGLAADDTCIQVRMLNLGKGPAVHSLRAQMDKRRYHERMKHALESEPLLDLRMGECCDILTQNGAVSGVVAGGGVEYGCRSVILAHRRIFEEPHPHRRLCHTKRAFGAFERQRPFRRASRAWHRTAPV